MWPIARHLKQSWTRWSLWKRALLFCVGLCVSVQSIVVYNLWRESQFRQRIRENGNLILGSSSLPDSVANRLWPWIGEKNTELFAPIVELYIADPTASDLASIASLSQLRALSINGGRPDAATFKRLAALRQLTTLKLSNLKLDDNALSGLSNCPSLCRIRLVGKMTPEALEPLKHCQSLCEVYLAGCDFGESIEESPFTASHLAAIAKIPHLKHLRVEEGAINDTELRGLIDAQELETLTVTQLRLQTDGVNFLGSLPRFQQLALEPSYDLEPYELQPWKGFPALKSLSIADSRITTTFLAYLAEFPKLEALSLRTCQVNESIAQLGELPKLKLLYLGSTDVESRPYRKIGHLNARGSTGWFIDEQIQAQPDLSTAPTINEEDYFNQPEWPEICVQYLSGFW